LKFVTYQDTSGATHPGLVDNGIVFNLKSAGYASVLAIAEGGQDALAAVSNRTFPGVPLASVKLLAPIPRPPRIFGIGLNYKAHAAESNMKTQAVPTVFMKLSSSVVGPGANIILPTNSQQVDYEAEFAVVIGKPGYRIAAADWQDHVFGYTVCNDVSARDIQLATSQWNLGKSFPTFTPLGPCIVTPDEITDPHDLDIRLTIDGEELQNASTRDLIFRIPELIEYISSITPLETGDIISTGTPQGVGLGRTPQRWLKPNEEVTIEISFIGALTNRTVAEQP
jgi:2-keto-4-pentenoate hydratase/2-oxohepta-3-ene-1,7-dioic acid hydratase in catechol pathway